MIKIILSPNMYDCPNYWKNFVDFVIGDSGRSLESNIKRLNKALEEYNGNMYFNGYKEAYLTFLNEEDFVIFKLRWL